MFRIDNSSAIANLEPAGPPQTPGFFTDGNRAAGVLATIVDSVWANNVQEEILTVIYAAGIAPDKSSQTQLLEALNRLYAGQGVDGAYLPLLGGTLYRPGGNDPLTISVDAGRYARINYSVSGTRHWVAGCRDDGHFEIHDVTGNRGGLLISRDNGTVELGRLNAIGPVTGYNDINVVGGKLWVDNALNAFTTGGGGGHLVGPWHAFGRFLCNDFESEQNVYAPNGYAFVGNGLQVGGRYPSNNQWTLITNGPAWFGDRVAATVAIDFVNGYMGAGGIDCTNGNARFGGDIINSGDIISSGNFSTGTAWASNGINVTGAQLWVDNAIIARTSGGGILSGNWLAEARLRVNEAIDVGGTGKYIDCLSGNAAFAKLDVSDIARFSQRVDFDGQAVCNQMLRLYNAAHSVEWDIYNRYGGAPINDHYFLIGVAGPGTRNTGIFSINPWDGYTTVNGTFHGLSMIWASNGDCRKPGGGEWNDTSDARLKKEVQPYRRGLAAIRQLQPVTYQYNGLGRTADDGTTYHGLIAQDAEKIMPEMVYQVREKLHPDDAQDTELYMMNTTPLTYALVNAVADLAGRVEALERNR